MVGTIGTGVVVAGITVRGIVRGDGHCVGRGFVFFVSVIFARIIVVVLGLRVIAL